MTEFLVAACPSMKAHKVHSVKERDCPWLQWQGLSLVKTWDASLAYAFHRQYLHTYRRAVLSEARSSWKKDGKSMVS